MKKQEILWSPMPKQARLLTCPAFEAGYGGAPGAGKSDVMLIDPLQGMVQPGFKALILRRKLVDLERSLIIRSHELYRGRGVYDGQKKRWRFPRDCAVEFGHVQRERDIYNYQSAQYQFIGVEQMEQFMEPMYLFFFTRCRTTNPNIKCKVRSNFNPGGIGHTWIKKRFWIHDRQPDRQYDIVETMKHPDGTEEEFKYQRAFIPATVYDNEHIMKNDRQYLMRLMSLPEPTRTAYLEGRFDLFEGQFFKEWNQRVHVVEPFPIPKDWRRWIAFDWGYNDKTCVLWMAEDPKTQTIYVYRELYINETLDIEVARQIQEMTKGDNIYTVIYPWDLDNTSGQTGESMHERMDKATGKSWYWKVGNKSRVNGWSAVRYLLGLRPDGSPRMKIFSNCSNLVRTIPEQIFSDSNSEDLDTLGEDHAVDALRYFAATFRTLDEMQDQDDKVRRPTDLGGAWKLPNGQYAFKRAEAANFAWMSE